MTYTDSVCDNESEANIDQIMVSTKIMQVGADPQYYAEHGRMRPTFTNRDSQMLLNDYTVHLYRSVEPWNVYFKFAYSWWEKLPLISHF